MIKWKIKVSKPGATDIVVYVNWLRRFSNITSSDFLLRNHNRPYQAASAYPFRFNTPIVGTNWSIFVKLGKHNMPLVTSSLCIPLVIYNDRLCGLVVRVSGYRSRGPQFDSRRFQIFWEATGLERGPLNLVRTTEELFGRNSSGFGQENRD
jgi:hypothetical protein